MLSVTEQGRLSAMLHLLPFRSELGRTGYIYGVATAADRRRCGLATRLMHEAIDRARTEGYDALMLIPADEELRRFYARFGFRGACPVRFTSAADFDFGTGSPETDLAAILPLNEEVSLPDTLNCRFGRQLSPDE